MKPSDYRREYAAYCAARERALYDHHAGLRPELNLAPLRERYADLWARERVGELAAARDETPGAFETERAALRNLTNIARLGWVETRARAVTQELARCESSARVEWGGVRLGVSEASERVAAEVDAAARRNLAARWLDALRGCDDLRAARLEALNEAARSLDFRSYGALSREASGADGERLAAGASSFLERTGAAYASHAARWCALSLPPQLAREPAYADALFFTRLPQLDQFFPAREAQATYAAALADLGVRTERQSNLRLEVAPGPGRKISPRCFALQTPGDVRLVFRPQDGAPFYLAFFRAAARAQHFAWTSRDSAARYPEFIHSPDPAARAGYAFLFGDLLFDAEWLAAHRGLKASEAGRVAHDLALAELYDVRRACALLLHELESGEASRRDSEASAESFAARLTEATRFRHDAALHLYALNSAELRAADYLRARLFAASLAEYLRTRHGRRWWSSRAAGDELIDLWNTGARYSVEELASLAGAGAPDFALLADALSPALGEG